MSVDPNLIEIRQKVEGAIADLIGDYTTKTTTGEVTSKAIAVLPHLDLAYDYPIAGTGVTGLQVLIVPTDIKNQEGIGDRIVSKTYLIILLQYDRSKGVSEACDRLLDTDLQFINNAVAINMEDAKSNKYKTAILTIKYHGIRSVG